MPCNNIEVAEGPILEVVNPECNPDLEAQKEYIGQSNWVMLINQGRYNQEKFDEESIEYFSEIIA